MGISDREMTAYFLDQKKALPYLQKAAATAAIGAEALAQGLKFDQKYAETLATSGLTAQQSREGYSQIAGEADEMAKLGAIYGVTYNQRTAEQAILENKASAQKTRGKLASRERAQFGGGTGAARGGLSQRGGQY
jgi:hypothetical protein